MNSTDQPTDYIVCTNPDTGEEELMAYWMPDGIPLPQHQLVFVNKKNGDTHVAN